MMAALLFEPFLFLLLNFWWVFFFSSIAAGLKCGCVDLCVSYISMWPSSSPVPVRRHLEERLTTVFNAIWFVPAIPNGRRCRFVFSFSRCRFFFVFLHIRASFLFRRPFFSFSPAVWLFCWPFFLLSPAGSTTSWFHYRHGNIYSGFVTLYLFRRL